MGPGRWTEGHGLGIALRPDTVYRREEATREAFTPVSEAIMSTPRHEPLTMPQPESNQPFGEAASGSNKPFGEAASVSNKPFGESASISGQPFIVSASPGVPISCGPPYVSYSTSPSSSLASSYKPPQQYQAVDILAAAVAQGGKTHRRVEVWSYISSQRMVY
jgi:hypothetical protein